MATKLMTLQEAADELGLHYMTVYRYVRTGRLHGTKDGAEWRVKAADVRRLAEDPKPGRPGRGGRTASYTDRLEDRLVAGDAAGAWTVVEGALAAGADPAEAYLELLVPVLRSIGDGWADGTYSIAQEHQATAAATGIIGRLGPRFTRRGRKRGSVVVGAPPGDAHALPIAMAADLLRGQGFQVHALGNDVPADSFAETAEAAERLVAVAVCATSGDNERNIRKAVRALREVVDVPLFLGGGAIDDPAHAADLGADAAVGTMGELVDALDGLAHDGAVPERYDLTA
jgi:excisionase family DNA binding protein